jgi:hypothetical protein
MHCTYAALEIFSAFAETLSDFLDARQPVAMNGFEELEIYTHRAISSSHPSYYVWPVCDLMFV